MTRGDANPAEDLARVTKENYLGKAVLSVPYLGYAVMFLQRREVKAAAGILAAAFFLKELLSAINKEGKPYEKT